MTALIPNRLLFDFEFPLHYRRKLPSVTGRLADWTDRFLLPDLCELDARESFGSVWACWNEEGIAVACRVQGKKRRLQCSPDAFWKGDNLRVCIDTRDTRTIKRATKNCHQFYLLPTGGGASRTGPAAASAPIQRARGQAPQSPIGRIEIAAEISPGGYRMEAVIPAPALHGYEPAEHPRIGFYYMLEDLELGQQYLTVGDDLYWHIDPSTWPTAVLTKAR